MKCTVEISKCYFSRNFCDSGSQVESVLFQLRGSGAGNQSINVVNMVSAGKPSRGM